METYGDFASFVRAHTSAFLQTAYLLTGNGTTAEELVQDTLVRLYPKRAKIFAADVPVAYVRRCIVNGFVNGRRGFASREAAFAVVPDQFVPDAAVGQIADRDEVWCMLRQLPQRQRAALVLRYYHDLPDAEIASVLGCRGGTVRSLLSRGLAAMREYAERSADSAASRGDQT